jgi:hypothetical protein
MKMRRIISRIRVWLVLKKNKFASASRSRRKKIRVDGKSQRRGKSWLKKIAASIALVAVLVSSPVQAIAEPGDLEVFGDSPKQTEASVNGSGQGIGKPARIAVMFACAGGFTLVMLIRRRRV